MGIFAVILGLLGVAGALMATFLFGTMGAIVSGVLGALAIILGVAKRSKAGKGGIAAIVIGILAIILTVFMDGKWSDVFSEAHNKAVEHMPESLWAQATEENNGGLMGIIKKLPTDEASINALIDELNELNKLTEK